MDLSRDAAAMLVATNETGIHSKRTGNSREALEDSLAQGVEPCVKTLPADPEDCGKLPVHSFLEPTNDSQGIEHVPAEFRGVRRFDPVDFIEVENREGSGNDVVGSAGDDSRLPDCRRGHRTDRFRGCHPLGA